MRSAAVAVVVETAQALTEPVAAVAAAAVARLDKPGDLVRPVKDRTAVMLARTHIHTAALVAVAQARQVRSAMPGLETVAMVLLNLAPCSRAAVAAVMVALVLEVVAQAAAVLVVAALLDWEPTARPTQAAVVVVPVRQTR